MYTAGRFTIGHQGDYFAAIGMTRPFALACAVFGSVMVSTPFLNSAETLSPSTMRGA